MQRFHTGISEQGKLRIAANNAFGSGLQFAWDSTSITLASTCLRKYYYSAIEGWRARHKSPHLIFGGVYASALEHYYKLIIVDGKSKDEALRAVVREALVSTWEKYDETISEQQDAAVRIDNPTAGGDQPPIPLPDNAIAQIAADDEQFRRNGGRPWASTHAAKTRGALIRTIIWYIDHFEEDPIEVITLSNGKPAVEYSFSLAVDNGIVFSGHWDRLGLYSSRPYVVDQKTTGGTLSRHYFDQYKPDTQMSMYTFAGKAVLGEPIRGVIIDAAQIAVGFTRFERGETTRTEMEILEWYEGSMYTIEKARAATREEYFPMNTASCGNYGGCEFRRVCSTVPSLRANALQADFVRRDKTWDPLERR